MIILGNQLTEALTIILQRRNHIYSGINSNSDYLVVTIIFLCLNY